MEVLNMISHDEDCETMKFLSEPCTCGADEENIRRDREGDWCEHIVRHKRFIWHWRLFSVGCEHKVTYDWKFCPVCNAPRPEEKGVGQSVS